MADDKTNPPTSAPAAAAPPTPAPAAAAPPTVAPATQTTGTQSGTSPGTQRINTAVTSGTRIMGTYEVEQLISKGGMGEVYRGRNIHTGDPVAIKIVLPHLAQDEMISQLFQKEAKVLGRLNADAIVRYHVFTNDPEIGRPSLIMEFVEGTSMNDRMKQGPMPEDDVRVLLRRLAGGLDKAHGVGVVHRDLSPDNVILEDGLVEHAKIIDFGIAKSSMKGTDATLLQGQFAGKFSFVAPEQLGAYGGTVDQRTDIYSLALMMVAACQGRNLNMGKSIVEAVKARSAVPDLPMVPAGLRPLLEHMLEPDPANRPASMAEVIRLIDNPAAVPGRAAAGDDDPDRTRIVSASALAGAAGTAPGGSAPRGSLPPVAAAQRGADAVFVGVPSGQPAAATPEPAKGGKGGLMAVAAVAVLAIGGGGAWMGGLFGGAEPEPPPVQEQPGTGGTQQPGTGGTEQPGTGGTEQPGTGGMEQPGTGGTEQPGTGGAEQPGTGGTEQPGTGGAEQPGTGGTEQPGTGGTEQPGTGGAEQPGTGGTEQPGSGGTEQPGTGGTEQPGGGTTADPTPPPPPPPPTDPMDIQAAWVQEYNPGACAFVAVRGKTPPAVALEGFARDIAPFTALLSEFTAQFGTEPALDTHAVNEPQCPIVDYMGRLRAGDELPPAIVLDNPTGVVKSGETVAGRIEGLAGRAVTLFLVNGVGGATNLKNFVARSSDGTVSFSFTVNLAAGSEPTPQLLLALVTKEAVTKLDVVPNGVTARALVPFMETEIERARQDASADLRFFRLEN
jgi:serine/threonine-protein kinase